MRLWTLRLGSLNLTHAVSDPNLGCFPIFYSPMSLLRSYHSPHTVPRTTALDPFMHPALVSELPSTSAGLLCCPWRSLLVSG